MKSEMTSDPSKREKCLIVGFGDLGRRLATRLTALDYAVFGVSRSQRKESGVELSQCDATDAAQVTQLFAQAFDILVIILTPDEASDAGYRRAYVDSMANITQLLQRQTWQPRLVLFVSSTGVYGQADGSWVDESSPTAPTRYSGRRLLEAERLLLDTKLPGCAVRFSGIYGPGRERLLNQVRRGEPCLREPGAFTNRIHAEDCAAVLTHLIERQAAGAALAPVYLASDQAPVARWEVMQWLAAEMAVPLEVVESDSGRTTKRCSNKLLRASGFEFSYPSFREGYGALIDDSGTA